MTTTGGEAIDEAGAATDAASAPVTGRLVSRCRDLLRRLTELAAARSEAESETEGTYRTALAAGREQHDRARTGAAQRRETELRRLETAQRDARERLESKARETYEQMKARQSTRRAAVVEKTDASETMARDQWQEAEWLAETVFEASEDKPVEQLKLRHHVLDARDRELHGAEEVGRTLMRKYRQPLPPAPPAHATPPGAENEPEDAVIDRCVERAVHAASRLHGIGPARFFKGYVLVVPLVLVAGAAGTAAAWRAGWQWDPMIAVSAGGAMVAATLVLGLVYATARRRTQATYRELAAAVRAGEAAIAGARETAESVRVEQEAAIIRRRDEELRLAKEKFAPLIAEIEGVRTAKLRAIDRKYPLRLKAIKDNTLIVRERIAKEHEDAARRLRDDLDEAARRVETEWAAKQAALESTYRSGREELESAWRTGMDACTRDLAAINVETSRLFPAWSDDAWKSWTPPTGFVPSVPIGRLHVDRRVIPGGVPEDERLRTDAPSEFELPVTLDFPGRCSLLVDTDTAGRPQAVLLLRAAMMRLLTALPPGKVRFTIIDPVGLGENFAGFMHLADYEEAFIATRIWTETRHIEQRLSELTEHMETVIQKYLRNEFEAIADYNERAGEIAEPYRFLVICDFPAKFSEAASRRLASILRSGPRCGVFTLLSRNPNESLPKDVDLADLKQHALTLVRRVERFVVDDGVLGAWPLELDAPPPEDFLTEKLHQIGEAARDASRVEVPFATIAPGPDEVWTGDCGRALTVPLGRSGATKRQDLVIGPGTSQHVLLAGKTGSGKSTLLHVLITNLALWYSPDEVQFYLVDFKKGVEFKTYARHGLPHARAVAVESDREFGLSVLQRIDAEMKDRGDRYRVAGVQDLAQFRKKTGETMPRLLLIVDEFQEMFVEDDKIGQDAALLLDRLVRQGRAFGIHVILGSQTLGGAYTLTRSTMGQMQVRIALQCTEADAYMIMNDDNAAARLLSRPGEAIYNDAGGALEANSPFQICWLPESVREQHLALAQALAAERDVRPETPMVVFEGNVPAEIETNRSLATRIDGPVPELRDGVTTWLGDAIAIKDPTAAVFRRQSGRNLLLVGQQDEPALAMTTSALVSVAAHLAGRDADDGMQVVLLDGTPADAPHHGWLERVASALPITVNVVAWRDVPVALAAIAERLNARGETDAVGLPPIFLVIHALQRFRMLRTSDDFGFSMGGDDDKPKAPDRLFAEIIQDGPPLGVHTIAWCDTGTNLNRTLDRAGLREFEMRVLMQMGGTDSTQLVDAPVASTLGLQRALYFNEEEGTLEKFRPYALPSMRWIATVAARLASR